MDNKSNPWYELDENNNKKTQRMDYFVLDVNAK